MVVGRLGEQVHPILSDLHPLRRAELSALGRNELGQIAENLHIISFRAGPDVGPKPSVLLVARPRVPTQRQVEVYSSHSRIPALRQPVRPSISRYHPGSSAVGKTVIGQ